MIRDTAAMNASLDNDYGTTRGPNAAASHQLALFDGDPTGSGLEVSGGGYARQTVAAADWLPAEDGLKTTAQAVYFPEPTGAWSNTASYWALIAGGVMWDFAPLSTPITVGGAGSSVPGKGPGVQPTVFYDDVLNTE